MVVIFLPTAADTGITHERVALPSTCTVQAPQSAMPQPYLVPVRPTCSRIAHSSGVLGSTFTSLVLPLIVRRAMSAPSPGRSAETIRYPAREGKGWRRRSSRQACHQLHRLGLVGHEREAGDAAVGPRAVVLADPRDGAHQRHLVAELVGHGGHRLVLAPGQVQLLDALGGVAEAAADHHLLVEVLVAVAHAADVERHARLLPRERALDVVGDGHLGARLDLEIAEALAAAR